MRRTSRLGRDRPGERRSGARVRARVAPGDVRAPAGWTIRPDRDDGRTASAGGGAVQVLQVQLAVQADPAEVGRARRWVLSRLLNHGVDPDAPVAETVVLVVSELVTNAVVHTGCPAVLRLCLPVDEDPAAGEPPGPLRVEVADASQAAPARGTPGRTRTRPTGAAWSWSSCSASAGAGTRTARASGCGARSGPRPGRRSRWRAWTGRRWRSSGGSGAAPAAGPGRARLIPADSAGDRWWRSSAEITGRKLTQPFRISDYPLT